MNVSFGNPEGAAAVETQAPVVTEKIVTPTPVEEVTVESTNPPVPQTDTPPFCGQATVVTIEGPASGAPLLPAVPATRQQTSLAPTGIVLGDKIPDFKDIVLPRVNIVQGIGELNKSFPVGALVFNQTTTLFTPPIMNQKTGELVKAATAPVVMCVLGFRPTRFVEKVKGGGRGLIVDTEQAVRDNGGTLDYNEHKLKEAYGMKRFEQLAEAFVAIRRPEICADDDTVFVYTVGAHKYALALWGMKGTAYTAAAKKVFFTARGIGCLKQGYPTYHYNVSTRLETYPGGNAAWIPVCLVGEKSNSDFITFAREILGG